MSTTTTSSTSTPIRSRSCRVNGKPLAVPEWRDTVIVERKGGQVVFRSRFLDYTGVYMLHCHMMNHEEMGMMQTVEVYKS